ncbi:hypothetical protein GCM10009785_07280 [Brooklawnia cerclae]|uniref:GPP34 family phosphoprotein n=1 Tax=Brooklawnia cerclae TaxID=349934 RepID=A0ABX0SJZ8_9ACTN|nr:GPP34 family phosphoprotein [Brooklawnia cerclae]NIH58306.1 hypothetical protein [Brooklawnia cerclae]
MVIAEDLFLLLTQSSGASEIDATYRDYALTAAAVTDLVADERVWLSRDKEPLVNVLSDRPVGHPVLDDVLARVARLNRRRLSTLFDSGGRTAFVTGQHLATIGVVRAEKTFWQGWRFPEVDPRPEQLVRLRLTSVLRGDAGATDQEMALLALLDATEATPNVLRAEVGDLGNKEIHRRIGQITQAHPAGAAVRQAIEAATAVMVATIIVPGIVT